MCMSVKISPNGSPLSALRTVARAPLLRLPRTFGFISQRFNIPSSIRRLVRLSSTINTFTPRKISGGAIVPTVDRLAIHVPSSTVK